MSAQPPLTGRSVAVARSLLAALLVLLSGTRPSASEPLNALVPATVEVPSTLRTTPFARDRVLMIPRGFKISVLARIPAARFIMPLSTGEILVAQPATGRILVVRPQADGTVGVSTLISRLRYPQGMALYHSDDKLYLYVGESKQVSRFTIAHDAASEGDQTVIVPNLPDSSSPELGGFYRHVLKNLVIGPDKKLYVDIAPATNANPKDTTSNPVRSAIYQYDLDGSNAKIFARGIRNAEGVAFVPGTKELWAAVNETDDVRYPFRNSWQDSEVPERFRNGVALALHGSWDRSRKTGYKVIFFPWKEGRPGRQIDLVTGWLDDRSQRQWGRPVDVKPANDGSLLISDDYSGTIYRLAPLRGR